MDVNKSEARREIELLKRQMKDREVDHARETDNLREAQHAQIESMVKNQSDTINRVRQEADEEVTNSRDRFDSEIHKNTDYYQKAMDEERAEAYDRYGRLANESSRERAKLQEKSAKQMQELLGSGDARYKEEQINAARAMNKVRQAYDEDRKKIREAYDRKLEAKDNAIRDELRKQTSAVTAQRDEAIRQNSIQGAHERAVADSRYRKLAEDSTSEREHMTQEMKNQEALAAQVSRQKVKQTADTAQRSYDDYRERATAALNETIENNNARESQNRRAAEVKYSQLSQQAASEKQKIRNDARSAEAALVAQNNMDRDRSELKSALAEKRHRDEVVNAQKAALDNTTLINTQLRENYNDNLHDLAEKSRNDFEKYQGDTQRRMYEMQMSNSSNRAEDERDKAKQLARSAMERAQEKKTLVRQYEARQSASDERNERQINDQRNKNQADMSFVRDKAAKDVRLNNLENTTRLYAAQRELRDTTNEMEFQRKNELENADSKYRERVRRLTDNYNRQTIANQDNFDEASTEYKHETLMQMAKLRGDAEHEKRIALTDLVMKNRALMTQYESKINAMKDEHDADLAKSKAENDKLMRETMRRAKDQMETERSQFQRELQAKDLQMREKLKLQEEAFRDNIEKLKHTHEAQLKKS